MPFKGLKRNYGWRITDVYKGKTRTIFHDAGDRFDTPNKANKAMFKIVATLRKMKAFMYNDHRELSFVVYEA